MAEHTKIGWTDHTFNPWVGCTKVSAACDNCYAEGWAKRAGRDVWGHGKPRQRTKTWGEPVKWNAAAKAAGVRRNVFGGSLCDVFDAEVPDDWRDDYHDKVIERCPDLNFLLLTKRPKVAAAYYARRPVPENVWLGTTVENQKMADLRIPDLLKVPAKVRFLSIEPMLGDIDLRYPEALYPNGPPMCCDVREIRRLLAEGRLSQNKIAARFGVYSSAISNINLRRTWAWLT